jgi:hypothetical protein
MVLKQIDDNRYAIVIVALGIVGLIFAIIRYVAQVFIADMSRAEQKLRQMASYDSLTNLLNWREAFQRITNEIARSARTGSKSPSFCVILITLKQSTTPMDTPEIWF